MTALAKEKENKLSFADVLKKTTVEKKTTAKKSGTPELTVPDHVKAAIDRYNVAKEKMNQGKAEMTNEEPVIIDHVKAEQDKEAYAGNFKKSYKIEGNKSKITFVTANKFSINPADVEEIKDILGDSYDNLIEEKPNVTLKETVLQSAELQEKLISLVGEHFAEFFETTVTVKVKEDFDKNIYNHVDKDTLDALRIFVKQNKPSLR